MAPPSAMASTFTWAFAPVGICPLTSRAMLPTSPCIVIDVGLDADTASMRTVLPLPTIRLPASVMSPLLRM
ncbi:hypothetical protein G6F31_020525 [Rhizopus arrhizus]|nr:hypothetical protein G6F31_020525 [Rhizopus arrhizus]